MIPVGLFFFLLGLRVNEYGIRLIQTFFGELPDAMRFVLFGVEHFLISWTVSVPLLLALAALRDSVPALLLGTIYGFGLYVTVNSLALPWIFGDPTPWHLGLDVVYPSLIVHLVYGAVIALSAGDFVARRGQGNQARSWGGARATR